MFDKGLIETDAFMDMPMPTKALYFLLGMEADDEGFVSPNRVIRIYGGNADDLKVLITKGFVIQFESGVVVITDWKKNNWLDSRRIKETVHQAEKKLLGESNEKYHLLSNRLAVASPEEYRGEEKRVEERRRDGREKISRHADTESDPLPRPTPFPGGKKPRSPREWANLRRAEIGKGPIRPKQSEKQLNSVGALLLADYFKEKSYSEHGLTFLAHDEDRKSVESANGKLRKLMSAFYKRCDYDTSKARSVIDWFISGEGEWCGYAPENCFRSEIVARFENKDVKTSESKGKMYE